MKDTRQRIVEATQKLIWNKGINNINVSDICEEANYSKMTFYRNFENKYDVVKEILDANYQDMAVNYDLIFNKNIPFVEKIMEIIFYNMEATEGISQELINDIVNQKNPVLKDYMFEKTEFYKNLTLKYIIREQRKGNFREDVSLEFISFFLDHINELLVDDRLKTMFSTTAELSTQLTKMFYFGILKRN